MINVAQALKEQREKVQISQSELAKMTKIKQQNISRWENGVNIPNIYDCIKLAVYYGISLDLLVGLENEDGARNEIDFDN